MHKNLVENPDMKRAFGRLGACGMIWGVIVWTVFSWLVIFCEHITYDFCFITDG